MHFIALNTGTQSIFSLSQNQKVSNTKATTTATKNSIKAHPNNMISKANSIIITTLVLLFAATNLDGVVAARQLLRGQETMVHKSSNHRQQQQQQQHQHQRILVETKGCPKQGQYCPEMYPGIGVHRYAECNSELSDIAVGECVYNRNDGGTLSWSRVTNRMDTGKKDKTTARDTTGYNMCYLEDSNLSCA